MTRFVAENLATSHWFDITRARELLGYHPQWTGERGFDEYFNTGPTAGQKTLQEQVYG